MRYFASIAILLAVTGAGCVAPTDHYTRTETGPHGQVTIKKVYYTPEEQAARQEAQRYANSRPEDSQMRAIEQLWPRLTEQQKDAVLRSVQQMAGQQ